MLSPRSNRLWTIRTQRPCRVWQLRGPSLRAALRMYPDTADRALEFVRGRLTAWMEGRPEDEVRLSVGSTSTFLQPVPVTLHLSPTSLLTHT